MEKNIVYGIMNEPHDCKLLSAPLVGLPFPCLPFLLVPDINVWAGSVQAAVTAIRNAGATENMILMPSTGYTGAQTCVSSGSAAALFNVTNADGSTTNLVYDVHRYLDNDGSGLSSDCVSNRISDFQTLGDWLQQNNRQAFLSEIGGMQTPACVQDVSQALGFLK